MNAAANTRPGVLKADPFPAFQRSKKYVFHVAVCKSVNAANPFFWSITEVHLHLLGDDTEKLDALALIEALRGEHDLRDGRTRSAAVRAAGSAEDSALYFSFHWARGGFLINRVGEVKG